MVSANHISRDLSDLSVGQGKMRLKMARRGDSLESLSSKGLAKGTVTDYVWTNPHVFVKLNAKHASGSTVHWNIEAQNLVSMIQTGWSKNTLKPGDEVEIDAMSAKNSNPVGFLGSARPSGPRKRIVINGKQFLP